METQATILPRSSFMSPSSSLPAKLITPPQLLRLTSTFKLFSTTGAAATTITTQEEVISTVPKEKENIRKATGPARRSVKTTASDNARLKENWLHSLSCPFKKEDESDPVSEFGSHPVLGSGWVLGVDPDVSGALAVLKPDHSAQVYDSPHVTLLIGKKARKRLDAKSIVQLLQSLGAPTGTTAFLEQSTPYPQDGKQGWWSGGFGYGLWIGVLVASGFSVVPVPPVVWKTEYKLAGSSSSKDDSREVASMIFPSMASQLKRKKDHGRAEALLIAAYGKGLKLNSDSLTTAEDLAPSSTEDCKPITSLKMPNC